MSRKNTIVTPFQTKHLRFVETDTMKELSHGGFTLAFRLHDLSRMGEAEQARWESETGVIVQYSWAECNLNDNFHKKRGRMISMHRLDNQASNWYHEFALELTPEAEAIIRLGTSPLDSLIDLRGVEKLVARELVENFCSEQQAYTACGESLDEFMDFLVEYPNGLALDSEVLLTGSMGDEDFVLDEAVANAATSEIDAALLLVAAIADEDLRTRISDHLNNALGLLSSGIDDDEEEDGDEDGGKTAALEGEDDEATDDVAVDSEPAQLEKTDDGEGAGDHSFALPA